MYRIVCGLVLCVLAGCGKDGRQNQPTASPTPSPARSPDERVIEIMATYDGLPAGKQLGDEGEELMRELKSLEGKVSEKSADAIARALSSHNLKQMAKGLEEYGKEAVVKAQVAAIDLALATYRVNTGAYPPTLAVLTEDNALLKAEAILDPWLQPYQYDVAGPNNKGLRPDIWTVTPGKKTIGNWAGK